MRTTNNVMYQLTDTAAIMQQLRDTLQQLDPAYLNEDEKFQHSTAALIALEGSLCSGAEAYLNALEEELACSIIYIGWQGFQLNRDIFLNPINGLLLNCDYEELCQERRLSTIPAAAKARQTISAFCDRAKVCPEAVQCLIDSIADYYSYLKNAGYKLAHYFGFRLADSLLYYVLPGYVCDAVNTNRYTMELSKYLQLDLSKVG